MLAKHPPSENDAKDLRAEWYCLSGISAWHRVPPSPEWQEAAIGHLERLVERSIIPPLLPMNIEEAS